MVCRLAILLLCFLWSTDTHAHEDSRRSGTGQSIASVTADRDRVIGEIAVKNDRLDKLKEKEAAAVKTPGDPKTPGLTPEEEAEKKRLEEKEIPELLKQLQSHNDTLKELQKAHEATGSPPAGEEKGMMPLPQPPPPPDKKADKPAETPAATPPPTATGQQVETKQQGDVRLLTNERTPGTPTRAEPARDQGQETADLYTQGANRQVQTIGQISAAMAEGIRTQGGNGSRPISSGGGPAGPPQIAATQRQGSTGNAFAPEIAAATRSAERARAAVKPGATGRGIASPSKRLMSGLGFSVSPQTASFGMDNTDAVTGLSKNPVTSSGRAFTSSPLLQAKRDLAEERRIAKFVAENLRTAQGSTFRSRSYVENFTSRR